MAQCVLAHQLQAQRQQGRVQLVAQARNQGRGGDSDRRPSCLGSRVDLEHKSGGQEPLAACAQRQSTGEEAREEAACRSYEGGRDGASGRHRFDGAQWVQTTWPRSQPRRPSDCLSVRKRASCAPFLFFTIPPPPLPPLPRLLLPHIQGTPRLLATRRSPARRRPFMVGCHPVGMRSSARWAIGPPWACGAWIMRRSLEPDG